MTQVVRVIRLRKAINRLLENAHPQIYHESVPDKVMYPYLVYVLDDSTDDGSVELFNLEIDGWDMPINGDTTALEEMMGKVDNALHRLTVDDGDLFFTFYRENRRTLRDTDKRIKRRQLVFQVRVMGNGR